MIVTPLLKILIILLLISMGITLVACLLKYLRDNDIDFLTVSILFMIFLVIAIYIMVTIPLIGIIISTF